MKVCRIPAIWSDPLWMAELPDGRVYQGRAATETDFRRRLAEQLQEDAA